MTIQQAIDMADTMKPNMMPQDTKVLFLQEIDQLIYKEILLKHAHTAEEEVLPVYVTPADEEAADADEQEEESEEEESEEESDSGDDRELLVPDPYSMLYLYWLMSKIDLLNQEIDKYNNDRALFENAYDTMSDWWTRTRMPLTARPWFGV